MWILLKTSKLFSFDAFDINFAIRNVKVLGDTENLTKCSLSFDSNQSKELHSIDVVFVVVVRCASRR